MVGEEEECGVASLASLPFSLVESALVFSLITENGKAFQNSDFISCRLEFETGGLNGV
jgi:hypothetical protein